MIEGNFKDVSLPGLLQFLGAEVSKNYRVRVSSSGQAGEIYVCRGFVVSASFGLLEGEDAMCEFLSWRDGTFFVETLTPQVEVKKNLKRAIQPGNAFVDNSSFLTENNVGLNTVIVASKSFGSLEWQESLRQQPLEREDFVVLGWVGEGRTMRQALREFGFDIAQATGILCRLMKTDSLQILRPSTSETEAEPVSPEADPVVQRFVSTGGQNEAAATVAQAAARAYAQEATAAVAQDAFISTSFKPGSVPMPDPKEQKQGNSLFNPIKKIGIDLAQVRASMEARLRSRGSVRRTGDHPVAEASSGTQQPQSSSSSGNFPATGVNYPSSAAGASASQGAGTNYSNSLNGGFGAASANYAGAGGSFGPTASGSNLPPTPQGTGHGAQFFTSANTPQAVPGNNSQADTVPPAAPQTVPQRAGSIPQTTPPTRAAEVLRQQQSRFLSDSAPPEPAGHGAAVESSAWQQSPLAASASKSADLLQESAHSAGAEIEAQQTELRDLPQPLTARDPSAREAPEPARAQSSQPQKSPFSLGALLAEANQSAATANPADQDIVVPLSAGSGGSAAAPAPTKAMSPDSARSAAPVPPASTRAAQTPPAKSNQQGGATQPAAASSTASKGTEADRQPRSRTEALPMVTIDIDRLVHATFTPTQFGKLALTNPALDQHRRQTLLDVEAGKSLGAVIAEETRPAAAVLSSFRYCLDRGYIESADSVVPLTADLLLGRMEIDQYLLQRRRLTGDQLRDLVEIARNEAVKLTQVLVRSGFLTSADLETLEREQKRFAFK